MLTNVGLCIMEEQMTIQLQNKFKNINSCKARIFLLVDL